MIHFFSRSVTIFVVSAYISFESFYFVNCIFRCVTFDILMMSLLRRGEQYVKLLYTDIVAFCTVKASTCLHLMLHHTHTRCVSGQTGYMYTCVFHLEICSKSHS